MAQTMVNFRMDEDLKKNMERTCRSMGLTMTAAFTMFAAKVTKDQCIPFDVVADPFFSEENIAELERRAANIAAGKSVLKPHDLIEAE